MDVRVQRDRSTRSHRAQCPECGRSFSIITGNQDRTAPNVERLLRLQVTSHMLSHGDLRLPQGHGSQGPARPPRPRAIERVRALARVFARSPRPPSGNP